jgi:spermidine synthase
VSFLFAVVFVSGMAVMAVELTAVRLLAPFFGASLFVWTGVIGVVLGALSLGYWLGGRAAARRRGLQAVRTLGAMVFLSGLLTLLIPVLQGPVVSLARAAGASSLWPSLIASCLLFIPPMVPAGMVLPLATEILVEGGENAGRGVGVLFFVSTVGSLLGTFLPVLVTVPYLGARLTFVLFGASLLLSGALLRRALVWFAAGALAVGGVLVLLPRIEAKSPFVVWEGESVYQHLRVLRSFDGATRLEVNEGGGMQSLYHPDRILTGYYWDAAAIPPALNPKGRDYLFVGLGGGTAARIVHHFFPDIRLDGVEVDARVTDLGRRYFGLGEIPVNVALSDGRMFLERSAKRYDFVMVDVYKDNRAIPPHLATREFFELARLRMSPEGILLMNVSAPPQHRELVQILQNTLAAVFPAVYEIRGPVGASLLFGFNEPPGLLGPGMMPVTFDPSTVVATDDRSTIELLGARAVE